MKDSNDARLIYYYGVKPTLKTVQPLPLPPAGPVPDGLSVLILCAGKIKRWEKGQPAQLRRVAKNDPETALARIVRQVRDRGYEPIIVTHRDDIREATPGVEHFEPRHQWRTIADTWLYTRELWRAQTVVTLGDVIHGKLMMDALLSYRGSMRMVGNSAEIYSFTFPASEHDRVAKLLWDVNLETQLGSPWFIYRRWCGFPYQSGQRENKVFHWLDDRTCDIDGQKQYDGMLTIDWGKG